MVSPILRYLFALLEPRSGARLSAFWPCRIASVGENRKLRGKVAMVFGGSRGIGAAIVQRLAEDGADVALTYVSAANKAAEAVEATGRRGLAIKTDSADAAAIQEAVAQVVGRFGRFDIVVVNAGILRLGSVEDVSLEDLDRMLDVNVRGVFVAIQAAARLLDDGVPAKDLRQLERVRVRNCSAAHSMNTRSRGDSWRVCE
jgi:NAD(P)-dependent dehydrogenase (short-subunit alcohol dehydrogenase family)